MERTEGTAAVQLGLGVEGLLSNAFGIEIDKCVQLGIQASDLGEMGLGEFDGRNLLLPDLAGHFDGGEEGRVGHVLTPGATAESSMQGFVSSSPGRSPI